MWAVALDLTELESSINRKQKNMDQHLCIQVLNILGFPGSSAGRESAWDAGDPRLIPGLGRSAGEGISCPLQHSWASLVAQLVKNLPAMQETWIWSLGWEDPLEKEMALGFPGDSDGKESTCNVGDPGSIPGLGRSSREENGYPLWYSCLENPMDREAWQATGITWTDFLANPIHVNRIKIKNKRKRIKKNKTIFSHL